MKGILARTNQMVKVWRLGQMVPFMRVTLKVGRNTAKDAINGIKDAHIQENGWTI